MSVRRETLGCVEGEVLCKNGVRRGDECGAIIVHVEISIRTEGRACGVASGGQLVVDHAFAALAA